LEILHETEVDAFVHRVARVENDVFMFCEHNYEDSVTSEITFTYEMRVYNHNNMDEVPNTIELPGMRLHNVEDMTGCDASDRLYVLEADSELDCSSVYFIARDEDGVFYVETWISDIRCLASSITASAEGGLIMMSKLGGLDCEAVSIFSPDGFLQHKVILSPDVDGFTYVRSAIQKANGNLVLESVSEQLKKLLTEINMDGNIERRYESSLSGISGVNSADPFGRILINDPDNGIELIDSEFNRLEFTGPQPHKDDFCCFYRLRYDRERNEVIGICSGTSDYTGLIIFRLSEE